MRPGLDPGFTMIELMVAVMLGALVLMGLSSIYVAVIRIQMEGYKKDVLQDSASVSLKALTQDLAVTTSLSLPDWPCPNGSCGGGSPQAADELHGCHNFQIDPGPAGARIDVSRPIRTYKYCVENGEMIYVWQQGGAIACPPTYSCGAAMVDTPPAGGGAFRVAKDVAKDPANASAGGDGKNCNVTSGSANHFFCRPAGLNNQVELHYVVGSGTAAITVNTAVTATKPYGAPFR